MDWEEFQRDGLAAIQSLVGRQESLTLEFKSDHPKEPLFDKGELTSNGKKILAKELSAFSNSAGGIIVFGVDCRNVGGIDEVIKISPISHLARAETSVRSSAADLLQPRHSSIDIMAIATESPDAGYIVVNVPRSERRPHRSEAKGQKEYYKRSGTSAFPMEHYDIEDAFKRMASPSLEMLCDFSSRSRSGTNRGMKYGLSMQVALANSGAVSAKFVTLQISNRSVVPMVPELSECSRTVYDGKWTLAQKTDFQIHPDQTRLFESFRFNVERTEDGQISADGQPLKPGMLGFDFTIGAENMRSESGRFELDTAHIAIIEDLTTR